MEGQITSFCAITKCIILLKPKMFLVKSGKIIIFIKLLTQNWYLAKQISYKCIKKLQFCQENSYITWRMQYWFLTLNFWYCFHFENKHFTASYPQVHHCNDYWTDGEAPTVLFDFLQPWHSITHSGRNIHLIYNYRTYGWFIAEGWVISGSSTHCYGEGTEFTPGSQLYKTQLKWISHFELQGQLLASVCAQGARGVKYISTLSG